MAEPKIAVVIPYFQRTTGILKKCLSSVARQVPCGLPVEVLIVDDGSPVPALPELDGICWPTNMSVRAIQRENGGPGAARNTGLDAVSNDTRYVAFLDSDDEWSPSHLARAVAALESGFDLYFANHRQLGQTIGAFERANRIQPAEHPAIADAPHGLHAYTGDMFDQILRGNVIGTSTVVFRLQPFENLRFDVAFTTAGEDYLFWMKLATAGARIAFSVELEADYGRGVNVYSASGWGTDGHLRRVQQEIMYRRAVRKAFPLSDRQRDELTRTLGALRVAFLQDLLHRLTHRRGVPLVVVRTQVLADPLTFLAIPRLVLVVTAKALDRYLRWR